MNRVTPVREIRDQVDALYRSESRRVFATLVRLLGDFDLAEDAMHEAFAAAVDQWQSEGIPKKPRAWLVSTGRFRAIDAIRRRAKLDGMLPQLAERAEELRSGVPEADDSLEDDRLRLIFTCCHPALAPSTHVALTLREVCGLTTEQIASAFLTAPSAIAQRIVRGKAKIRDARIPYEIPSLSSLPDRLESVLAVIYLVFNEGYSASTGETLIRADLCQEAIRLGRLLRELLPDPSTTGLLALMLLQESRRAARTTPEGDLILLEDQDRSLWDRKLIAEGEQLVQQSLRAFPIGPYTVQAAIAAVHAGAAVAKETDWGQIVALYDVLHRIQPTPVVELNRAVAVAMRDGPQAGLDLIEGILQRGDLTDYHLSHAARGDLCRRLGLLSEAGASYQRALDLVVQTPERRFLERRLQELHQK